jgi:transposase
MVLDDYNRALIKPRNALCSGSTSLKKTAEHFEVREVSADKAYSSRKNLNAVESVGAAPSIPFKSNTLEPTEAGAWARMYLLFMYKREEYMAHYHKRSNIETAYSMIKGKFGSHLRSKNDTGQINEALCKVLAHNICVLVQATHELGIKPICLCKAF